jgi:branched-chain amino acid transport system permease protein
LRALSTRQWMLCAVAALVLASAPLWITNSFYLNVGSQILFWAIFALALNVLVGYAGLTSLGHAALFAMSGYTAAILLAGGSSQWTAAAAAIFASVLTSAVFAVLALRATGIGFLMITLALGQILWGIAYRWAALTNGDNGVTITSRPMPFGLDITTPSAFYWMTLAVFLLTMITMAVFVRSPFGAAVKGTRDQPRRMNALGYNVWLIHFVAFLFSGFWTGVAGLLFVYYNQFISPQTAGLQTSAEALLMVISGGTATVFGPVAGAAIVVIMKNVVSAYIERWNLVLGVIFVLIVSFMPDGLIPGLTRLWRRARQGVRSRSISPLAPKSGDVAAFRADPTGRAGGRS